MPCIPASLFSPHVGKVLEPGRTMDVCLVTLVLPILHIWTPLASWQHGSHFGHLRIRGKRLRYPWCGAKPETEGGGRTFCRPNALCDRTTWVLGTLRKHVFLCLIELNG